MVASAVTDSRPELVMFVRLTGALTKAKRVKNRQKERRREAESEVERQGERERERERDEGRKQKERRHRARSKLPFAFSSLQSNSILMSSVCPAAVVTREEEGERKWRKK